MSGQRAGQRTRILHAIVEVVATDGYLGAKIGEISGRAGVSRATFYELFESKQQCFLQAHRTHSAALLERVRREVPDASSETVLNAALGVLAAVAQQQPRQFSFLTHEAMLAGAQGLAARERLLTDLANLIDQPGRSPNSGRRPVPDMPARMLLGAVVRTLGMAIRRGERQLTPLLDELLTWGSLYSAPAAERRWCELESEPALIAAANKDGYATFTPRPSPRGRHGQPAALVRRTQRERILHASAAAISQKGYEHTTVADIVAAGGLSRDAFYSQVGSRRDALEQATRLFFEQAVAATAGVFFTTPDSWPERVWAAGVALSEFIAGAGAFAKVACIDSYAPGPAAAQRVDQLLLSFTVFIEAGASDTPPGRVIPPVTPIAVVAALTETVLALLTSERIRELPGFVALGSYLALAPYTGIARANELIDRQLHGLAEQPRSAPSR